MKSLLQTTLLLIAIILVVLACKNTDRVIPSPAKYFSREVRTVSKVRLFTADGEIISQSVVNNHVKKINSFTTKYYNYVSFYEKDTLIQLNKEDTLYIISENTASANGRQYIIKKSGQDLLFEAKDTVYGYYQNQSEVYHLNLLLDVTKYNPAYLNPDLTKQSVTLPSRSSLVLFSVGNVKSDEELIYYRLRYAISDGNQTYIQNIGDRFDTNGYRRLRLGDTLTVQEFDVSYQK